MLTIGNFLGGMWANESWGRYWGWDPKETWALISILIYAFVIHMRFVPGLRGNWTFNFMSILSFASILMTYFGVNFYLVGLHSYASGDKIITPNFVLNGDATIQPGNVFQLTPAIGNQSGSVWNNIQINLNNPFHFNIDIFLGCNNGGADGIAFVLQPISTSLGSSGGGLGYAGISPSFSVEFDTWQNSQYADPSYDHIAIQRNGILNHQSWNNNNLAGPVGFPPNNYQIEDCQWHSAVFMWNPATQTFTLDFDLSLIHISEPTRPY